MKYYEIMILVNSNNLNIIQNTIKKYKNYIENNDGYIYKLEDIGKMNLSYKIKKNNKAYFILFIIECSIEIINKLKMFFKFDSNIIRNIILKIKKINSNKLLFIRNNFK